MSYQSIYQDNQERVFALHERNMDIGDPRCCSGVFGTVGAPTVDPRDAWERDGVDFSDEVQEITDQDGLSLCHSFGGSTANEILNRLQGEKDLRLSAGNLAGQVTGYRNTGASVQEVLAVLLKYGQCPRSVVDQNDYRGNDWPDNWKAEAAKYRVRVAWDCGDGPGRVFDCLVSGLRRRWPGVLGTSAFGGGHAVAVTAFYWSRNEWWLAGPNSWGSQYKTWDRPGFWTYPESRLRDVESYGAFVLQASQINPDDPAPGV